MIHIRSACSPHLSTTTGTSNFAIKQCNQKVKHLMTTPMFQQQFQQLLLSKPLQSLRAMSFDHGLQLPAGFPTNCACQMLVVKVPNGDHHITQDAATVINAQ